MSEEILRNPWLVNIVVMLVLIWFSMEDIRLRSIGFKGIMIVITAGIIYRVLYILLFREVEIYSIITGILIIAGTGIYSVKTGNIGMGDVTVILFIGVVKGLEFALVSTMMALTGVSLSGIICVIRKKITGKTSLPFIPFLGISTLGVMLCG